MDPASNNSIIDQLVSDGEKQQLIPSNSNNPDGNLLNPDGNLLNLDIAHTKKSTKFLMDLSVNNENTTSTSKSNDTTADTTSKFKSNDIFEAANKSAKHDLQSLASSLTKRFSNKSTDPFSSSMKTSMTDTDLRKYIFVHSRGKQLMSGLRIHSFSKKSFISSFSVGLAVGCLVAIIFKLLFEVAISTYTNHYGGDISTVKHSHHKHHRNH
ncbi:hypothetical protein HELRODRAFT_183186 [Helobdella robusta]|uniref:Uncharacterized protein n=1 Tax=Helobdella robusta TaxID=6412 RepID=T1FJ98_HELRO|nr:hypothetical protein HELRODRAFT_183186 [Helobdella robusta]ESO11401.1 hypothetical protein HELRODRAFT_183186 [Helobdella robusta]